MKEVVISSQMNGISIDRSTRTVKYNMIKHWHPECEIQYFFQGKRHFFIDQQHYAVKEGSFILIDSNQVHNTYSDKELFHDRLVFHFDKKIFEATATSLGIDLELFLKEHCGVVQIPHADRAFVEDCLIALASEIEQKQIAYQAVVQLKFFELIIYLTRLKISGAMHSLPTKVEGEINDFVNEVQHYIRDNYATVGSLEEIAKVFYLDKSYLSRIFKKCTGYTITEFTNIQRIQQAQRLLEDSKMTVAQVASHTGYENVTYFNRVFKKYVETSPLQYRKKQIAYKKSLREKNNN